MSRIHNFIDSWEKSCLLFSLRNPTSTTKVINWWKNSFLRFYYKKCYYLWENQRFCNVCSTSLNLTYFIHTHMILVILFKWTRLNEWTNSQSTVKGSEFCRNSIRERYAKGIFSSCEARLLSHQSLTFTAYRQTRFVRNALKQTNLKLNKKITSTQLVKRRKKKRVPNCLILKNFAQEYKSLTKFNPLSRFAKQHLLCSSKSSYTLVIFRRA